MSHFSLLVINTKGVNDVEEQLLPYKEICSSNEEFSDDPRVIFNDKTDEYKEQYETEDTDQFYCESSSSWGMEITEEQFNLYKTSPVGREYTVEVTKSGAFGYYKKHGKYRGYFSYRDTDGKHKRYDGDAWFEVVDIVNTSHPDKDICFEGTIRVQVIEPPKRIMLKDRYETFEDFIANYVCGTINKDGRVGYYENVNSKWDWYVIGGRWAGMLKLKDGIEKQSNPNFSYGWSEDKKNEILSKNYVDQTFLKNIDWDGMKDQNVYDKAIRFWELIVDEQEPLTDVDKEIVKNNFYNKEYFTDKYLNKVNYAKCTYNFTTYAVLLDGKWLSSGDMGWFGVSISNSNDELNFLLNYFENIIKPLPENSLLTVVDCHI